MEIGAEYHTRPSIYEIQTWFCNLQSPAENNVQRISYE